ncbi:hypothetical protein A3D05_05200 [Candidatus Gottesmanbacteria bacterium RIFCSPHIGHO2_02_FULL_40_24]|uniref:Small ribosomal subunit protein bS20 n=1 Tax=Candidatus Gottesmanbacteria bacterium RIFCSPHIGHO2_01_FULL_40_15 TaxID=1798376 RepID=A0A1F5Z6P1_9BACT|nr:MAG: hypothetical protein A2777_01835 [Candidatus Gottesmanbacteria bacterium RIFCSPHIGHO2_01_FULL_40_15]OGG16428.1 MAG: hypothetical protein A3D05_05200 [Candidatus Gottesmanbacteria bacterium RIFCSPHIGHO2_02_FULL_40_24]OGG22710.1 MAG: hypothetical protein A3B48_02830 [Candidatus Gottesmanbacteria bacterium RIFCSPLOWO2_01_FULL_40_10]OGG25542.1 MAG: hypothetical protein A3E42_04350 [Candidatus Gottesmanbacteria bacterium RIFCSPHIGHO2_12_FULL_40_13]
MPVTSSAKKKLKQDNKRHQINLAAKNAVKNAVKKFRQKPSPKLLTEAYSKLDLSSKKNIYHANKVARMKSALAKLLNAKKTSPKPKKS